MKVRAETIDGAIDLLKEAWPEMPDSVKVKAMDLAVAEAVENPEAAEFLRRKFAKDE